MRRLSVIAAPAIGDPAGLGQEKLLFDGIQIEAQRGFLDGRRVMAALIGQPAHGPAQAVTRRVEGLVNQFCGVRGSGFRPGRA